jgi:DNA-binding CsgD family transcriptional regulator
VTSPVLDRQIAQALTVGPRAGLAAVVELVCAEVGVDRVSVAAFDDERWSFRVVASTGRSLFAPGTELPMSTSTQIMRAAGGELFMTTDFAREPGWRLPTDRIVRAAGFRSGCTVPIFAGPRVVGAISLSSIAVCDHTVRIATLNRANPFLAGALSAISRSGVERHPHLTRRERELLVDLDRGLRFKQIAVRMGISQTTVKGYARALFEKLDSHSRSEAVYEARLRGLLDLVEN